jgi:hypothetical protein
MARGIDQVQLVLLAVLCLVRQSQGVALDGYASFPLKIHAVQDLIAKLPGAHQTRMLDKAIRQGGFPVIDVCDDAEVSYMLHSLDR